MMARRLREPLLSRAVRHRRQRGQSLVEFALLLPVFILAFFGLIEFSMAFNASLNLGYAARNAALLAAEAGNSTGADCVILNSIESDINAPASDSRIVSVSVYWAKVDGTINGSNVNVYTRGGSTTCTYTDGTVLTVPYGTTSVGYPTTSRCSTLKGCGSGHSGLDTIGVTIAYTHPLVTPVAKMIGGSAGTIALNADATMRMEPVL